MNRLRTFLACHFIFALLLGSALGMLGGIFPLIAIGYVAGSGLLVVNEVWETLASTFGESASLKNAVRD